MNPFRTGKLVLFQVTYDRDWHFFEIIFFVILGIFGVRLIPCSWNSCVLEALTIILTGSLWCLCYKIQPTSRCFPTQALGQPWCGRGGDAGHLDRSHWLFQSFSSDRHDVEHGNFIQRVRRRGKYFQSMPVRERRLAFASGVLIAVHKELRPSGASPILCSSLR